MFLGFRMWFTGIYHHHIATKLNIHQGPLYGEVIRTKTKVPKALQIAETEKRVADGTPYRFYANETYMYNWDRICVKSIKLRQIETIFFK